MPFRTFYLKLEAFLVRLSADKWQLSPTRKRHYDPGNEVEISEERSLDRHKLCVEIWFFLHIIDGRWESAASIGKTTSAEVSLIHYAISSPETFLIANTFICWITIKFSLICTVQLI